MTDGVPRKKVAIVGSGSAGLAALWALNRTHHDVYVYEAADQLGGHIHTAEWRRGKYTAKVDMGFMAVNTATSANFLRFLDKLGVPTAPASVSWSVSRGRQATVRLDSLFCQRRNLLSPRTWRMWLDAVRFSVFAPDLLQEEAKAESDGGENGGELSMGQYLAREGYSDAFRDDFLLPMVAATAMGSTGWGPAVLENWPAKKLMLVLWEQQLLWPWPWQPSPTWRTVAAGAQTYVERLMRGFPPNHLFLRTPVRAVTKEPDGRVRLQIGGRCGSPDDSAVYDHVILATHGDEAADMIAPSASADERAILGCFQTAVCTAVLHGDTSLLPAALKARASCNWAMTGAAVSQAAAAQASLTCCMNRLQRIPASVFGAVLVTLNPPPGAEPDPAKVQARVAFRHMVCTADAVRAQQQLPRIQNTRGISYAGAWTTGLGCHEDGFRSGLAVAVDHLGARLPFTLERAPPKPRLGLDGISRWNPCWLLAWALVWALRVVLKTIQVFVVEVVGLVELAETATHKLSERVLGQRPGSHNHRRLKLA